VADPSPAQRRLAEALRTLRMRSGMSAAALARQLGLGWTQTKVSRTELAQRRISTADAANWAEAIGATAGERAELDELTTEAEREVRTWWEIQAAGGVPRRQAEVAAFEAESTRVCNFQLVVPGLLQTAAYARHVFALGHAQDQDEIEAAVTARMRRAGIFNDPGRQFDYVLSEAALRETLGAAASVLREQGERLLSLDKLPNVSLAVLPFTADPGILPTGGFTIYERLGQPLVLLETRIGDLTFGGAREAETYRAAFAALRAAAVTGARAHALIREAMITPA
jgi:transcriptional regulator with XRE-family HTH domain